MILGEYNELTVLRESDIAYLLTDGTTEIFLHKKEATKPYEPGEKILVFLYVDNVGRPTASTKEPLATISKAAFLEVVSVKPTLGVFLNNHLVKDLLLSLDDLPLDFDSWPAVGDMIFVGMKEKKSHLFAKIIGRKQIKDYFPKPLEIYPMNSVVDAYVQFITEEGYIAFTDKGEELFIHHNNCRQTYRIGQKVAPKVLKYNDHGDYSATLIEQKEIMITSDKEIILEYMNQHNGEMRFTDKSSPEEITLAFQMSKSAFKRALGTLYKESKVELLPNKTILKK